MKRRLLKNVGFMFGNKKVGFKIHPNKVLQHNKIVKDTPLQYSQSFNLCWYIMLVAHNFNSNFIFKHKSHKLL